MDLVARIPQLLHFGERGVDLARDADGLPDIECGMVPEGSDGAGEGEGRG